MMASILCIVSLSSSTLSGNLPAPLLEEHDKPSSSNALEVVPSAEDLVVLRKLADPYTAFFLGGEVGEILLKCSALEEALSLDLKELDLNKFVVLRQLAEVGESLKTLLVTAFLDEPARRERQPPN